MMLSTTFDLSTVVPAIGLFLTGTAAAYTPTAPLGNDGRWSVAPTPSAAYTTRVIVHRPIDPKRFNGTVVVEWLRTSRSAPTSASTGRLGHNELIRAGACGSGSPRRPSA